MRAPLSWLRDFTPIEAPAAEIARTLSSLGLVVEATEVTSRPFDGIVVARVLATRPHPAADRIHLVDVDLGDGEALQICCGAFNMQPGDLVPLATLGTVMPSGLEIGRRKMRGEWSNGMLCSAPELGLGPEGPEPAILLLAPDTGPPGQPLAEALGLGPDVVFDLEISPNRSDCFSIVGVARDLAAATGAPFSVPEPPHAVDPAVGAAAVTVDPAALSGCPRFTGTIIEGAGAAPVSPLVRHRLALAGMRPLHPVVDASNYVMLELGQPNHPYDITLLGGRGLRVRWAEEGESIVTLDGAARAVGPEDLLITDGDGAPVGVAGIMGGAAAEISGSTSTVLLEMANFEPAAIAATGRRLGLQSEARTRFERGVDIELPPRAIDRFVQLLGPGARRGPVTDVQAPRPAPQPVLLRPARANLVLGTALTPERCAELLGPLGFRATAGGDGALSVEVPSWRPDCRREVDLIEEIARMHGYERIPRSLPPRPAQATRLTGYQARRRLVRDALVGAGLDEAWTHSFLARSDFSDAGLSATAALELENPLDQSLAWLRTSLLPGLLRAAQSNVERQAVALRLFEIGTVFSQATGDRPGLAGAPPGPVEGVREAEQLAWLALGPAVAATYSAQVWEVVAQALRLPGAVGPFGAALSGAPEGNGARDGLSALEAAGSLHPGRGATVSIGGRPLGVVGELAPELAARYGLPGRVAVGIVDLSRLLELPAEPLVARAVSRFPASDLDMAFVVADEVPAGEVAATVRQAGGALVEGVVLFDVWRDASLGQGRRSLAFRARLRAADHTLTEAEVADVRERVAAAAGERHQAVLRRS